MEKTSRLELEYPTDKEAPDGPTQIGALAKRLDLVVPKFYTPKVIATEQSTESTSFTTLGTADEVKSVVVPENAKLIIGYRAHMKSSVAAAGFAELFIGANFAKDEEGNTVGCQTTGTSFGIARTNGLTLSLASVETADATTGQVYGRPLELFLAAGTYDISVKYKVTEGKVTAKERRLMVGVAHGF